jgi:signal transduction histidine kinase
MERLRYTVSDAETDVRGYAISGDPSYLRAYQDYWAEIDYNYDLLRVVTAGDQQQQQQLKSLKLLLEERRAGSASIIQLRREQGAEAARARYLSGRMQQLDERIRLTIDNIQRRERQALAQISAQGEVSSRRTQLAIAGGGVLTLLLGAACYFMLRRDLILRNESQHALQMANEQLHITSTRAQQADRIKTAFLATMSHELRTPLNSIIGFSGILFQELAGPLNAEQKKQLSMVRESSRHLLALVNDVLDISKVEAGQLKVLNAPFQINESLSRSVELITPMAEKKGLTLLTRIAADLGEIVSDKRRVEQVLMNLLSNAVKFTERGQIMLSAEKLDDYMQADEGTPQQVMRLQVSDTGVGISPEHLPNLFQPFRQLEETVNKPRDGTGLGLAITQRLLALMGGQISVESKVGEGSVFTVILPRQTVQEVAQG